MKSENRVSLENIAKRYNAAITTGKVKQIREVATEAHQSVLQTIKNIEATQPVEDDLLQQANTLFLDIRMGRASTIPI
ncbi:hypothetical protein CSQ94_04975 [Janthinobacterium sp. BJB312]|nr:hypothetical protein CSQ94_04975 [Janthinobacterium sp. BJB312]